MTEAIAKAEFSLRGYNPDVLTCIANLSNDEVFTPPVLANQMLDTLGDAWAQANNGENLWSHSNTTFLDPSTKSGVFLREIVARLTAGLAGEIPDLQARVDHILTKQVFGIATTDLTSLLSRRSVYCSKSANGQFSIAKSFDRDWGNVWFERTEHTWAGERCAYCGAPKSGYDRSSDLESHAYAVIHTTDVQARVEQIFGAGMQFDVIIGNPPYQLGQSGGDAVGGFAMPVYQRFVQAAKSLEPKYAVLVTPSRWFAGGRGLDDFRKEMLGDHRFRALVDFPNASDAFPGTQIKGGVSYFLWDSGWNGECEVTTVEDGASTSAVWRSLDAYDILVRRNEAVAILEKVLDGNARDGFGDLASRVSAIQPFSIRTNFRGSKSPDGLQSPVRLIGNGGSTYIERSAVPRNDSWIDEWKVLLGRAYGAGDGFPHQIFNYPIIAGPGTACTETYLVIDRFETEVEAGRFSSYLRTRFARFLVSLRKNTQDIYSDRFSFVPLLPMDHEWTDEELYAKYGFTDEEITFIAAMIRPMDAAADA